MNINHLLAVIAVAIMFFAESVFGLVLAGSVAIFCWLSGEWIRYRRL